MSRYFSIKGIVRLKVFAFTILLITISCDSTKQSRNDVDSDNVKVVCTTGMIKDALINILPTSFEVVGIMGPGVDPHLYKAKASDLQNFKSANLIVYNGHHLEGRLSQSLEHYSEQKPVYALAESLDTADLIHRGGSTYDPHIWFDVQLWAEAIGNLSAHLSALFPEHNDSINAYSSNYLASIQELHVETQSILSSVPEKNRVLVTAHDAFDYFGRKYGYEVHGLQGISTAAEYGVKDVTNLVELLIEKDVPAVFIESSIPKKSIEAVIAGCKRSGHEIELGGSLFSDAMGEDNSPEGNYIGMVRWNSKTITEALKNN